MNPEIECRKFKKQFSNKDWSQLVANSEFNAAWENSNLVRAGELAPMILFPEAKNKKERREARQLKKILDEFT